MKNNEISLFTCKIDKIWKNGKIWYNDNIQCWWRFELLVKRVNLYNLFQKANDLLEFYIPFDPTIKILETYPK